MERKIKRLFMYIRIGLIFFKTQFLNEGHPSVKTIKMIVSFELTMPNVGSWNGQWTGANKKYYIVKSLTKEQKSKIEFKDNKSSFHYNFGDGWSANVKAEIVDSKEASARRRNSKGFASYDWMVDEILQFGRIKLRSEREVSVLVS
jgi:hypothetical protein